MPNPLKLAALIVLLIPFSAHSSLYKFEYTGHVTQLSGNGMGYTLGQYMSGELQFDLSNSIGDVVPSQDYYSQYEALGDGTDFVTGHLTTTEGKNRDTVRGYNGFEDPFASSPQSTAFVVGDFVSFDRPDKLSYGLILTIQQLGVDWLIGDAIKEFNFVGADLYNYGWSFGTLFETYEYNKPDGTRWLHSDQALFDLDSAKLTLISVPEPGSLFLALIACIAIILRRRLIK